MSATRAGSEAPNAGEPLRLSDVIDELHRISDLAGRGTEAGGVEIVAACRRAESLLARLRNQFLDDVVADPLVSDVPAA